MLGVGSTGRINAFHFLCFKREYATLMTIQNFVNSKCKDNVRTQLDSMRRTFGFKNIDVKQGVLVKSGYINKKTQASFRDFISAVESLAINTYQEYVQYYRTALTQQDNDGRNPLHFSTFEKLVIALLEFGIDNDADFDSFSYECQQLRLLEDRAVKPFDPRRNSDALKDFKLLLAAKTYAKIRKSYLRDRKALIQEVLNMEDVNGQTPLHWVSKRGNYVLVRYFLRCGADPSKRDSAQNNPLDIAQNKYVRQALTNLNEEAHKGNESNITRLVDEGENINERISILGEGPIHKAVLSCIKNKAAALRTIIEHDAQIDLIDNNGWTALHHAAYNGDYESAQELCAQGANVNAYSNSMKTPLHFAAMNNHADVVSLLVAKGAKVEGITNSEIVRFAPLRSALIMDNVTPLLLAAKKGHVECFELLLQLGANLHETDARKWTCLHFAAYNGHAELCRKIIELDQPGDSLIAAKNAQQHLPFDICKNEQSKAWFRKKWKADEDKVKHENKLKKLLNKERFAAMLAMRAAGKDGQAAPTQPAADPNAAVAPSKEETKDGGNADDVIE